MMRVLVRIALASLAVVVAFAIVVAQTGEATIHGVVRDTSGAVLPGVTVDVSGASLVERTRTAITDANGAFAVNALPPGDYVVTASLLGFTTSKVAVTLHAGQRQAVSLTLSVAAVTETVTVSGETPIVNAQSTGRAGGGINERSTPRPTIASMTTAGRRRRASPCRPFRSTSTRRRTRTSGVF